MYEIKIENGIETKIEGDRLTIKGKLGSTWKRINRKLLDVRIDSGKIIIDQTKNKKLLKKSALAAKALSTEINSAIKGVQEGVETKMHMIYAHFPITIEVKGDKLFVKNIFGERVARETEIVGNTKVEVKGQDLFVKGVDPYDVGQTVANIRKACYAKDYDSRVFQDGLYVVEEE